MRFYTIDIHSEEIPAISYDGGRTAFSFAALGLSYKDINEFITAGDAALAHARAAQDKTLSAPAPASIDLLHAKLCSPIVHPRQDVICLGINYDEHAVEAGRFSGEAFGGDRPYTIYFSKRASKLSGTGDPIPAYEGLVDSLDYEAEFGVIIGKDTKQIEEENAESVIFGYTIINDVSARNLQTRHKQWYLGKSLDGFTPMGPCIVTPDEIGEASNLPISCLVNGELRQNSNTRYMIQTVSGAIHELSQGMTLLSGTIIATGTPAGVGMGFTPPRFLKHGDTVTCRIGGIGEITNTVD